MDSKMRRFIITTLLATTALTLNTPREAVAEETIYLLDKTKFVGKLEHYYQGLLTVRLPNGTKMQLPAAKVYRVQFKLPKPRAALSTPIKTFKRMRKAALKGDLATYIDCHASSYQGIIGHQVSLMTEKKFIKRLKKEYSTQMKVLKTTFKKGMAVVKIQRTKGDDSQVGDLPFVKENKEWKMILPL